MFRVRIAATEYAVPLPPTEDVTAGYVKQFLVEHNQDDLQVSPHQLRLMVKGKILADGDIVAAAQTAATPALALVRPSEHDIHEMHAREAEAKRVHDIRATRRVVNIQARNQQLTSRAHASTTYKFHGIETLPNLPNEATARNILESLATDPGILAVMAQHKWQVGALVEMFPDGKVGVDPVCVLGLNENKGQRIRLRLRTDDLLGFRKFLTIKNVLFHELSHNDVSDHNNEFYQLMRQVEAECNAVPMTRTAPLASTSQPGRPRVAHRLGHEPSLPQPVSSGTPPQPPIPSSLPSAAPVADIQTTGADRPPPADAALSGQLDAKAAGSSPENAGPQPTSSVVDMSDNKNGPSDSSIQLPGVVSPPTTTPGQLAPPPLAVAPLAAWDDVALAMGGERVQLVHAAIHSLHSAIVAGNAGPVPNTIVTTLHTLLTNVLSHPSDAKYKSIRKDNPRIARTVGSVLASQQLLHSVGFVEDATHWTLQRNDPGLLWLGKSALEALLGTAE